MFQKKKNIYNNEISLMVKNIDTRLIQIPVAVRKSADVLARINGKTAKFLPILT